MTKRGVYTPKKTKDYEFNVGVFARRAKCPKFEGHVTVECLFMLKNKRRVDIDNLVKSLLDGLNNIAWDDDCQVTMLHARKVIIGKNDDPCTVVTIKQDINP